MDEHDPLSQWLQAHKYKDDSNVAIAIHELCDSIEDLYMLEIDDFDNVKSVQIKHIKRRTIMTQMKKTKANQHKYLEDEPPLEKVTFGHFFSCPFLDSEKVPNSPLLIRKEQSKLSEIWATSRIDYRSCVATIPEFMASKHNIVHVSAHGGSGCLFLEYPCDTDNMGKSCRLSLDNNLKELKGAFQSTELLFLSVCQSEVIGRAFVNILNIPHVVVINRYF